MIAANREARSIAKMSFLDKLQNLELIDLIMVGSAVLYFSCLGIYAGLTNRRKIIWCAIGFLVFIGAVYHDVVLYHLADFLDRP